MKENVKFKDFESKSNNISFKSTTNAFIASNDVLQFYVLTIIFLIIMLFAHSNLFIVKQMKELMFVVLISSLCETKIASQN